MQLDDQIRVVLQPTTNISGRYILESELESFPKLADVITDSFVRHTHTLVHSLMLN